MHLEDLSTDMILFALVHRLMGGTPHDNYREIWRVIVEVYGHNKDICRCPFKMIKLSMFSSDKFAIKSLADIQAVNGVGKKKKQATRKHKYKKRQDNKLRSRKNISMKQLLEYLCPLQLQHSFHRNLRLLLHLNLHLLIIWKRRGRNTTRMCLKHTTKLKMTHD